MTGHNAPALPVRISPSPAALAKATGGAVKAEMHGKKTGATNQSFTDYWKALALTGGQGDFTAPFDGTHGRYFRNKGDTPVIATVKSVGFYKDFFQPKGA